VLTIGQLASAAGVTVRTVRHYHQIELLPEPDRDGSGYRRYPAQAVVDLVRIRTLADAGVPLARISNLLQAPPDEFRAAICDIDDDLQRRITELSEHRRRIAALGSGDALFLPREVTANLDRLRALGVSERALGIERDAWILMRTLEPECLPQRIREKNASFDDPATMRLYLAVTRAIDWEPHDPRLDRLIDDMEAWEIAYERDGGRTSRNSVLFSHIAEASPALRRALHELTKRAGERHKRHRS